MLKSFGLLPCKCVVLVLIVSIRYIGAEKNVFKKSTGKNERVEIKQYRHVLAHRGLRTDSKSLRSCSTTHSGAYKTRSSSPHLSRTQLHDVQNNNTIRLIIRIYIYMFIMYSVYILNTPTTRIITSHAVLRETSVYTRAGTRTWLRIIYIQYVFYNTRHDQYATYNPTTYVYNPYMFAHGRRGDFAARSSERAWFSNYKTLPKSFSLSRHWPQYGRRAKFITMYERCCTRLRVGGERLQSKTAAGKRAIWLIYTIRSF